MLFFQQNSLIQQWVKSAFFQCKCYGTATELLKLVDEMDQEFVFDLINKNASAERNDKRKFVELLWAADDTFHIFTQINAKDKAIFYDFFRRQFQPTIVGVAEKLNGQCEMFFLIVNYFSLNRIRTEHRYLMLISHDFILIF